MAIEFTRSCDVGQGYNFKQDEHLTFGYITQWSLGDNDISPDIKVVEPGTTPEVSGNAGTTGEGTTNTGGVFNFPVVAVLCDDQAWSTLPNENITLKARISLANAQQLHMLTMQSLKKVVMQIGFVIYDYDLVNQAYYTSFKTFKGVTVNSSVKPKKPGTTAFTSKDDSAIFALLGKDGTTFGIKVSHKHEEDPAGIKNHLLELTLAPPISESPQQILIQTSQKVKLIQPWGIPQK